MREKGRRFQGAGRAQGRRVFLKKVCLLKKTFWYNNAVFSNIMFFRRFRMNLKRKISLTITLLLAGVVPLMAGNLDSPGASGSGSGMVPLQGIYDRLNTGAFLNVSGSFAEPAAGPGATGVSLNNITSVLPQPDDTNGLSPSEAMSGKTFWGLRTDGTWGPQTGSLATQTLSETSNALNAGYYAPTNLTTVDTDLAAVNIKSGVTIFGETGTYTGIGGNVQDTSSGNAVAADILSGRKAWVGGSEVTGSLSGGGSVCTGTMNGTRWCDQEDGTVLDMTTGLVWLKDANCFGTKKWADSSTWDDAQTASGTLLSGSCGLTDGSLEGDWRLPTKNELLGLVSAPEAVRSPSMRAFTGVQASYYWSATTYAPSSNFAWVVDVYGGFVYAFSKAGSYYVWPVRAGQ